MSLWPTFTISSAIISTSELFKFSLHIKYLIFCVCDLGLKLANCIKKLEMLLFLGHKFGDDLIVGEGGALDASDCVLETGEWRLIFTSSFSGNLSLLNI